MTGHEIFFTCPYCYQSISMVLDSSIDGKQKYIEDCEVCCRPIEIEYEAETGEITHFDCSPTQKG